MTALTITLLLTLTALAGSARSGSSPTPLITTLNGQVERIRNVRAAKCLSRPVFRWHPGHMVPPHMRLFVIGQRRERLARARAALSMCPVDVLYRVFPAATEDAAYRVAYCESVGFTDFLNEGSGASGMFQLMPIHWRGKFNPFNHLANARFALRLSRGGYDWSAWVCKP